MVVLSFNLEEGRGRGGFILKEEGREDLGSEVEEGLGSEVGEEEAGKVRSGKLDPARVFFAWRNISRALSKAVGLGFDSLGFEP